MRFVEAKWAGLQVHGWGAYILKKKLKALKTRQKYWNANVFGDISGQVKEVGMKLEELEKKVEDQGLSEDEDRPPIRLLEVCQVERVSSFPEV